MKVSACWSGVQVLILCHWGPLCSMMVRVGAEAGRAGEYMGGVYGGERGFGLLAAACRDMLRLTCLSHAQV